MGIPGIPFNVPKERIAQTIKECKGVVRQVCIKLGYGYTCIWEKITADPELKALLDKERASHDEDKCDKAEETLDMLMLQSEDKSIALGAVRYLLNNKGRGRGYNPPLRPNEDANPPGDKESTAVADAFLEKYSQHQKITELEKEIAALRAAQS